MNLFISQPINGKSDKEIQEIRDAAIAEVKDMFGEPGEPIDVIDFPIKDIPNDANPLWYLGNSILLMSKADIVYFAKGWRKVPSCVIENNIANVYGLCCIQTG